MMFLTTPFVLGLALLLPASTAASSLGSIKITSQFCKGDTVHVTFQVVKNANHYADRFTLTATGQGSNGGAWHTTSSKKYSYTIFNPNARAYFSKTLKYNSAYLYSRIQGTAKYYSGNYLVATAKIASGYC
jgi:hypothetical protein